MLNISALSFGNKYHFSNRLVSGLSHHSNFLIFIILLSQQSFVVHTNTAARRPLQLFQSWAMQREHNSLYDHDHNRALNKPSIVLPLVQLKMFENICLWIPRFQGWQRSCEHRQLSREIYRKQWKMVQRFLKEWWRFFQLHIPSNWTNKGEKIEKS